MNSFFLLIFLAYFVSPTLPCACLGGRGGAMEFSDGEDDTTETTQGMTSVYSRDSSTDMYQGTFAV
jgi:hypothetical protein